MFFIILHWYNLLVFLDILFDVSINCFSYNCCFHWNFCLCYYCCHFQVCSGLLLIVSIWKLLSLFFIVLNITIYVFINIFTIKVLLIIINEFELVFRLHIYQFYTNVLMSILCMCILVLAVGNNYFYL